MDELLTRDQIVEIDKYRRIYAVHEKYRMAPPRLKNFGDAVRDLPWRRSYLDIGCGRGEMLALAQEAGFRRVAGVEVVDALVSDQVTKAPAWDLPFEAKTFEVVTMFDVIEHLLPGDDEAACREMLRVASKSILVAANSNSSVWQGIELHCNQRPPDVWDGLFREWFTGRVTWLRQKTFNGTELWRIDL
jgi:SAM-dependent methyltransferase